MDKYIFFIDCDGVIRALIPAMDELYQRMTSHEHCHGCYELKYRYPVWGDRAGEICFVKHGKEILLDGPIPHPGIIQFFQFIKAACTIQPQFTTDVPFIIHILSRQDNTGMAKYTSEWLKINLLSHPHMANIPVDVTLLTEHRSELSKGQYIHTYINNLPYPVFYKSVLIEDSVAELELAEGKVDIRIGIDLGIYDSEKLLEHSDFVISSKHLAKIYEG